MSAKIVNVLKWVAWVHEIFHWIPAKLLTTNVKAHADRVEYDLQDKQWKNVVIAGGPLAAALVVYGLVALGVKKKNLDKGWLEAAGLYVGACYWDIGDLIYFAVHKEWRHDAKRWL